MLNINELIGFGSIIGNPGTLLYKGFTEGGGGTTITYTAYDIGIASDDRIVFVAAHGLTTTARTISSVTIGGIKASKVIGPTSSANQLTYLFKAPVPSGTTANIVVTFSGSVNNSAIAVWTASDFGFIATNDSGYNYTTSSAKTVTVSGVAQGFALIAGFNYAAQADTVNSYSSNLIADYATAWGTLAAAFAGRHNPTSTGNSTYTTTYSVVPSGSSPYLAAAFYSKEAPFISSSEGTRAGTGTVTVNAPSDISPGDLLLCFLIGKANGAITNPSGWVTVISDFANPTISMSYKFATGNEPSTYAWSISGATATTAIIVSIRGANVIDAIGTVNRSTAATVSAPSITPTLKGLLLGSFMNNSNSETVISAPPGMTLVNNVTNQPGCYLYATEANPLGSTGTKSVTWSASGQEHESFLTQVVRDTAKPYVDYVATYNSATNASSYTFTAASLGSVGANRKIIITVSGHTETTGIAITGIMVAGTSAVEIIAASGNLRETAIWIADVPIGTTGNIVVSYSGTVRNCTIGVYAARNLTGMDAISRNSQENASSTTFSTSVTGSAPGFVVSVAGTNANATCTWSSADETFDTIVDTQGESGACINTALAQTVVPAGTWTSTANINSTCSAYFQIINGPWVDYVDRSFSSTNANSYTWASAPLGAVGNSRKIIVTVAQRFTNTTDTTTAVTIAGISATQVAQNADSNSRRASIWIADVPSGTTGDIVISCANALNYSAAVYAGRNLTNTTAADTATASAVATTISLPVDGTAAGFAVACSYCPNITTWTGINGSASSVVDGEFAAHALVNSNSAGTVSITVGSGSAVNTVGAAAYFQN